MARVDEAALEKLLEDFAAHVLNSGHQWGLDRYRIMNKYVAEFTEFIDKYAETKARFAVMKAHAEFVEGDDNPHCRVLKNIIYHLRQIITCLEKRIGDLECERDRLRKESEDAWKN